MFDKCCRDIARLLDELRKANDTQLARQDFRMEIHSLSLKKEFTANE